MERDGKKLGQDTEEYLDLLDRIYEEADFSWRSAESMPVKEANIISTRSLLRIKHMIRKARGYDNSDEG